MNKLVAALKALPLIRFALMLGGGAIASLGLAHVQWWVSRPGEFPSEEAIWLARIDAMKWLGMSATAVVIVVMITLAWGKVGKVTATVAGNTVDLDFEDGPEQGTTTTVTTEVKS